MLASNAGSLPALGLGPPSHGAPAGQCTACAWEVQSRGDVCSPGSRRVRRSIQGKLDGPLEDPLDLVCGRVTKGGWADPGEEAAHCTVSLGRGEAWRLRVWSGPTGQKTGEERPQRKKCCYGLPGRPTQGTGGGQEAQGQLPSPARAAGVPHAVPRDRAWWPDAGCLGTTEGRGDWQRTPCSQ